MGMDDVWVMVGKVGLDVILIDVLDFADGDVFAVCRGDVLTGKIGMIISTTVYGCGWQKIGGR